MKKTIKKGLITFIITLNVCASFAQKGLIGVLSGQDTTTIEQNKTWLNINAGMSMSKSPKFVYLFPMSSSVSVHHVNKKRNLIKVKAAISHGTQGFSNFAQNGKELNLMTGKIFCLDDISVELYYGIGLVNGIKRGDVIPQSRQDFWDDFTKQYIKEKYMAVGIPLEVLFKGKTYGCSFSANLNKELSYVGMKVSIHIGQEYRK